MSTFENPHRPDLAEFIEGRRHAFRAVASARCPHCGALVAEVFVIGGELVLFVHRGRAPRSGLARDLRHAADELRSFGREDDARDEDALAAAVESGALPAAVPAQAANLSAMVRNGNIGTATERAVCRRCKAVYDVVADLDDPRSLRLEDPL